MLCYKIFIGHLILKALISKFSTVYLASQGEECSPVRPKEFASFPPHWLVIIPGVSLYHHIHFVYYTLPDFLFKRLQHLQFAAASYVTGCYVKDINNALIIGWLPVKERRDFHLLKLVFKVLYSDAWPSYLKINEVVHTRLSVTF